MELDRASAGATLRAPPMLSIGMTSQPQHRGPALAFAAAPFRLGVAAGTGGANTALKAPGRGEQPVGSAPEATDSMVGMLGVRRRRASGAESTSNGLMASSSAPEMAVM
eukprot:5616110-Amphidinium_carterae.3